MTGPRFLVKDSEFKTGEFVQVYPAGNTVYYCRIFKTGKEPMSGLSQTIWREKTKEEQALQIPSSGYLVRQWLAKLPFALSVKVSFCHCSLDLLKALTMGWIVRAGCNISIQAGTGIKVAILEVGGLEKSKDWIIAQSTKFEMEKAPQLDLGQSDLLPNFSEMTIAANDEEVLEVVDQAYTPLISLLKLYTSNPEILSSSPLRLPRGVLLHGPPGKFNGLT